MNRAQVESLAAVLDVTFRPAELPVIGKGCSNVHRDYRCANRATEEAVKRTARDTIAIRTCSDAYCRISAAIHAHALSLPAARGQVVAMDDFAAQQKIRARAQRSLALLEGAVARKFGRHLSLVPKS